MKCQRSPKASHQIPISWDERSRGRHERLKTRGAGSLERGLAILAHLASRGGDATAADIAGATGTSRSATYRLIERMRALDLPSSSRPADDGASGRRPRGSEWRRCSRPMWFRSRPNTCGCLRSKPRRRSAWPCSAAPRMVFVYRERGPQAVTVNAELGGRRPLHCTSLGKAYLAALRRRISGCVIRDAPARGNTPSARSAPLLRSWRRSAAPSSVAGRSEQREFDQSTSCCGAAIRDHTGLPVASISVAGFADRVEALGGAPRAARLQHGGRDLAPAGLRRRTERPLSP